MVRKILVVDDERQPRLIVARAVEALGHVAIHASSADTALSLVRDNPDIGLIVTDMQMPGMDGRELIVAVRKLEEAKHIPIIIVSGVVGPKQISDLMVDGASRFLPKPVDVKMLKEYLVSLLTNGI